MSLGVLAVLPTLCGCSLPLQPPVNLPPTARTIDVIAAVPPTIQKSALGVTVFGNADETVAVPTWRLDGVTAKAAISGVPTSFKAVSARWPGGRVPDELDSTAVAAALKAHVTAMPAADLYLVIWPEHSTGQLQATAGFHGFGATKEFTPFWTWLPVVHTFGTAALYDGHSFALLDSRLLRLAKEDAADLAGSGTRYDIMVASSAHTRDNYTPMTPVDIDPWPDQWSEFTSDQQARIRNRLSALIMKSVGFTVRGMFEPVIAPAK